MLIKFESVEGPIVLMLDDIALPLIRMMGMSGRVPGAVLAKDIPGVLAKLEAELHNGNPRGMDAAAIAARHEPISARAHFTARAQPLVDLLEIAGTRGDDVMWDQAHPSPLLTWP